MLDVHPPHAPTHTWRDFLLHIATIVIGLLIAIGLEQTVEAIHHHHQRERLEQDLHDESVNNVKTIDYDLRFEAYESWYDHAAASVTAAGGGPVRLTLTTMPCIPGTLSGGSFRLILPYGAVWSNAQQNGTASLVSADRARVYVRRAILLDTVYHYREQLFDNCIKLNAFERRLARPASDYRSFTWTMTPAQAEDFAALASIETATMKAFCFRMRYLEAFEQDLLDGGHRINGASLNGTLDESLDAEDRLRPR